MLWYSESWINEEIHIEAPDLATVPILSSAESLSVWKYQKGQKVIFYKSDLENKKNLALTTFNSHSHSLPITLQNTT